MSPNFAAVPKSVINDKRLSKPVVFTAAALAYYADKNGLCTISYRALAERARTVRSRLYEHLNQLEACGHIRRISKKGCKGRHSFQILNGGSVPESGTKQYPPDRDSTVPQAGTASVPETGNSPTPPIRTTTVKDHRSSTGRGGAAKKLGGKDRVASRLAKSKYDDFEPEEYKP